MHKKSHISFFTDIVLLAILGAVFVLIRFNGLHLNFWQDEPYTVMAAQGVLKEGLPKMPSGLWYVRGFPFTYAVALMLSLFGSSEWILRLIPLIIGGISLIALYVCGRILANRTFAFVLALVLALSPWHGTYSLFLRTYLLQAFLFFLILWNYYRFLQTKKANYLYTNTFFIILNSLLSPSAILSIFALLYVGVLFVRDKKSKSPVSVGFVLLLHSIFIAVSAFVPGAVISWQQSASGNAYDLFSVKSYALLNTYFWKTLFHFFPFGFFVFLASFVFFFIRDRKFFIFPFFLVASFFFLSVINPFGNLQPRYLSNFIFVYFFTVAYFSWRILAARYIYVFILVLMFSSDIFYTSHFIKLTYGSKLYGTMLVSESWREFPDISSGTFYVNRHYKKGDIIISLQPKGHTEVYSQHKVDYLLRTKNYKTESHFVGNNFVDDYSLISIIDSPDTFKNVIKKAKGRVFVISSKSADISLQHIDKKTLSFIKTNANSVYSGREKYSEVFLFDTSYLRMLK